MEAKNCRRERLREEGNTNTMQSFIMGLKYRCTYYPPCQHLVPEGSSLLQREQNATYWPMKQKSWSKLDKETHTTTKAHAEAMFPIKYQDCGARPCPHLPCRSFIINQYCFCTRLMLTREILSSVKLLLCTPTVWPQGFGCGCARTHKRHEMQISLSLSHTTVFSFLL